MGVKLVGIVVGCVDGDSGNVVLDSGAEPQRLGTELGSSGAIVVDRCRKPRRGRNTLGEGRGYLARGRSDFDAERCSAVASQDRVVATAPPGRSSIAL